MAKDNKKKGSLGGLFIPAGIFLGFGFGFLFNNIMAGFWLGFGAGFLTFVIYEMSKKKN
jgi:hypothetical protein